MKRIFANAVCALLLINCAHQKGGEPKLSTVDVDRMRYEMAEALVKKGAHQEAALFIRSLLSSYPKSARLHLLLGIVLRDKGVYGEAEKEIRAALKLNPNDPDSLDALGVLLVKKEELESAETVHRRSIDLAANVARYHNNLGVCLAAQQKLKEAKAAFEHAIRQDPNMRRAFNNLGFVLGLLGEEDDAYRAFENAGGRALALTNMGYISQLQGSRAQARNLYEKALQLHRGYEPALRNLRVLEPGRWPAAEEPGDLRFEAAEAQPKEAPNEK